MNRFEQAKQFEDALVAKLDESAMTVAQVTEWSTRPRTTVISALARLEKAGRVTRQGSTYFSSPGDAFSSEEIEGAIADLQAVEGDDPSVVTGAHSIAFELARRVAAELQAAENREVRSAYGRALFALFDVLRLELS